MVIRTSQDVSEIERSLIGNIIVDSDTIERCLAHGLTPNDFTDHNLKAIYQSCLTLNENHKPVDVVTLSSMGHDLVTLGELTMNIIPGGCDSLINAILTYSARQKAVAALQNCLLTLRDATFTTPGEVVDVLQNISVDIPCSDRKNKTKSLFDVMVNFPDELEREAAGNNLRFGWRDLDGLTGGLWPAELTIIAAAPGQGKTGFVLNIAHNTAKQGANVLLVSLEMSNHQLAKRFCSIEGNVEGCKLRRPRKEDVELWKVLPETTTRLSKLPITIDQTKTIQELENKCRRLKERNNIDLLIIDYLQLLKSASRSESRRHEVEYVSRCLKLLSLELNIPIIALSQLSREGQRAVAPSLNDLRESGSLEQDADNVIFLHDPNAKDNLSALWVDINVIVAKQRSGQTGLLQMRFDKRYMRFYETER
jgi:replicative DNA helicase